MRIVAITAVMQQGLPHIASVAFQLLGQDSRTDRNIVTRLKERLGATHLADFLAMVAGNHLHQSTRPAPAYRPLPRARLCPDDGENQFRFELVPHTLLDGRLDVAVGFGRMDAVGLVKIAAQPAGFLSALAPAPFAGYQLHGVGLCGWNRQRRQRGKPQQAPQENQPEQPQDGLLIVAMAQVQPLNLGHGTDISSLPDQNVFFGGQHQIGIDQFLRLADDGTPPNSDLDIISHAKP